MTFGELMDKLNDLYVGNERGYRDMPVMVSNQGIISPMGDFLLMGYRMVFCAAGEEVARESELGRIADELGRMNKLKEFEIRRKEAGNYDSLNALHRIMEGV